MTLQNFKYHPLSVFYFYTQSILKAFKQLRWSWYLNKCNLIHKKRMKNKLFSAFRVIMYPPFSVVQTLYRELSDMTTGGLFSEKSFGKAKLTWMTIKKKDSSFSVEHVFLLGILPLVSNDPCSRNRQGTNGWYFQTVAEDQICWCFFSKLNDLVFLLYRSFWL